MTQTTTPLSHRLRNETKEAHTTAERSGIMRDVLRGTVSIEAYVALLTNLLALYETLEQELDRNRAHVALSSVDWSLLKRAPSLRADIAQLGGISGGATEPSTIRYVSRLQEIGATRPALLFSHAYLRYLGDLYGGQIMKRILSQKFPEYGNTAFTFYEFNELPDASAFKVTFREAIDSLPLAPDEPDLMVAEAMLGYELHAAIFNELASEHAAWRSANSPTQL